MSEYYTAKRGKNIYNPKSAQPFKLSRSKILQIHDELVFDLPVSELKALSELVKDKMEHVYKLDVPIKVDMKKGVNWLQMAAWHGNQGGLR